MDTWIIFDIKSFCDEDGFNIISIDMKDDIDMIYLDSFRSFLSGIRESYPDDKSVIKQADVDIPRQLYYVNDIRVNNYKDLVKKVRHTDFLKQITLVSTQASMFPVIQRLFCKYHDDDIHVTDFTNNNPLIFRLDIIDKDDVQINISKKFRVIKLDKHSSVSDLDTLQVIVSLKITKNDSDVLYSVLTYKDGIT